MSKLQYKTLGHITSRPNTESDWHSRGNSGYTKNEIEHIEDPAAGSTKEITSIPSPLARMHLFENAFQSISDQASKGNLGLLEGKSKYHQLVSDALDTAEVFFNYRVFNNPPSRKLKILKWNKKLQMEELRDNASHRLFAETLELFLNQDSKESNFHEMENLYFLYCDNQLIGSNSPSTLFFAAHNDGFQLAKLGLKKGNSTLFDQNPQPLHKRSLPFLRYVYGLFTAYNKELREKMNILWSYFELSLKALRQFGRKQEWTILQETILQNSDYDTNQFTSEFAEAFAGDQKGAFIEVLPNIYHRFKKEESVDYSNDDFAIKSKKFVDTVANAKEEGRKVRTPLVLQNGFSKPLKYGQGLWNSNIEVPPYVTELDLEKRTLPGKAERYPWLTISDFLEPYVISLIFNIDREHFFDGNMQGFKGQDSIRGLPGDDSYLIPIKRKFFEYFDASYLKERSSDGKANFKIMKVGEGSVRVELRVPIKAQGQYLTFERLYKTNVSPDERKNEGAIKECRFTMAALPLISAVSSASESHVYQHICLIDADTQPATMHHDYDAIFFTENGTEIEVGPPDKTTRSIKTEHDHKATSKHFVLRKTFSIAEISINGGNYKGMIITKNPKQVGFGAQSTYVAIDLGTTNTFVAMSSANDVGASPFQIGPRDKQLITLHDPRFNLSSYQLEEVLTTELPPAYFGMEYDYWFPIRTAIMELGNITYAKAMPIGDIPIAFFMQRRGNPGGGKSSSIITNLKWLQLGSLEENDVNQARIRSFIAEIMILIRNKVLLNNGNLDKVNLVWFYPSSMGETRHKFNTIWQKAAVDYISPEAKIYSFQESLAPYYAYGPNQVKGQEYPVINIDIGGGTTDVAIFEKEEPNFTTSFRFAGNSVFGDGYRDTGQGNGFVQKFKKYIGDWIKDHNLRNLSSSFSANSKLSSSDMNSFFFSIETNKEVKEAGLKFSFSDMLAGDDDAKFVFLIFASSIFYHLAKLMSVLEKRMPRHILFSGKGSNILKLLDPDPRMRNTEKLVRHIFEKVYDRPYHKEGISIISSGDPKGVTCMGGIELLKKKVSADRSMPIDDDVDKVILIGDRNNRLSTLEIFRDEALKQYQFNYGDLNDSRIKRSVVEEVQTFINILFEICYEEGLFRKFLINYSKLGGYKSILERDLLSDLESGISSRIGQISDNEPVAETMFFYPLIGRIYRLTQELH